MGILEAPYYKLPVINIGNQRPSCSWKTEIKHKLPEWQLGPLLLVSGFGIPVM